MDRPIRIDKEENRFPEAVGNLWYQEKNLKMKFGKKKAPAFEISTRLAFDTLKMVLLSYHYHLYQIRSWYRSGMDCWIVDHNVNSVFSSINWKIMDLILRILLPGGTKPVWSHSYWEDCGQHTVMQSYNYRYVLNMNSKNAAVILVIRIPGHTHKPSFYHWPWKIGDSCYTRNSAFP